MDNKILFLVVNSLDETKKIINLLTQRKKIKFDSIKPLKNQTQEIYLIPTTEFLLSEVQDIIKDIEVVDLFEAKKRGWYFGSFKGTFAREREKLEDVHFIFDALIRSYGKPNFPATRAICMSFLSACYVLQESINKKILRTELKMKLGDWWKDRKKEQNKKNELLKSFEIFMHTEKHGGVLANQVSDIELIPKSHFVALGIKNSHIHANPNTLELSAQGAFMTAYENTPNERRFPVGLHDAVYEIKVKNAPKHHLGHNIDGISFLEMMNLIKEYYMYLLFEAETILGERKKKYNFVLSR